MDLLPSRQELYDLVKRGDLANMSFGFTSDKERFTRNGDTDVREVEAGTLYEVSLVHSPAYSTTTAVAQRSLDDYKKFKEEVKASMEELENKEQQEQQEQQGKEEQTQNTNTESEEDMANKQTEQRGIDLMATNGQGQQMEVRAYGRNERMSNDADKVTAAGLIRAYVTGEATEAERRALNTTGTSVLVPKSVVNKLIDKARDKSFLFKSATTVDMQNHKQVTVPKVLQDPTVAPKLEGELIAKSEPTFGEVELNAKFYYGLVEIPLELLKTGLGIEEKVNDLLAKALVEKLEYDALNGSANGFEGIYNDADVVKQDITEPTYKEIAKGYKAIAKNNGEVKDLVISTNNELDCETQTATDGQFVQAPEFYKNLNKQVTNAIGDDKMLIGDLSQIYLGLLQGMQLQISTDYGFDRGVVGVRILWYGDIKVAEPKHVGVLNVTAGA
jgi:HK97 family phage major capsid protein